METKIICRGLPVTKGSTKFLGTIFKTILYRSNSLKLVAPSMAISKNGSMGKQPMMVTMKDIITKRAIILLPTILKVVVSPIL